MSRCSLCNKLEKKDKSDVRLALEFKPKELLDSAENRECWWCAVILGAITRFGYDLWPQDQNFDSVKLLFVKNAALVYVYGVSGSDNTLSVEIYLKNNEPKRILELFYPEMACKFCAILWNNNIERLI